MTYAIYTAGSSKLYIFYMYGTKYLLVSTISGITSATKNEREVIWADWATFKTPKLRDAHSLI